MGFFGPEVGSLAWERRCLAKAKRQDRGAIAALYAHFAPRLFREVLMPKLGNRSAAEDALSETFRTFIERIDSISSEQKSLYAWLAKVASNKAIDMYRKEGRRGRALVSFEQLLGPLLDAGETAKEAEQRLDRRHLERHVRTVLGAINPRYKRAIELRFFEEKSRTECADLMEVTPNSFDVLIFRSLKSFRKEWERALSSAMVENVT